MLHELNISVRNTYDKGCISLLHITDMIRVATKRSTFFGREVRLCASLFFYGGFMGKTCVICGKPSGMYPLCRFHLQQKNEGLIEKCDICGTWHYKDKPCNCNSEDGSRCIVCGGSTKDGWRYLCPSCYSICLDYTKEMNKNYSFREFSDYYYNAKSNIYRLTGFEKFIKPNCIKLVAIAKACDRYADNDSLLKVVEDDIREIVSKKKSRDIIKETEEKKVIEFNVKKNQGALRGVDGHFLDSDKEKQIDDLLFSQAIPHAIHYTVTEISERTCVCDWYIPVTPNKGIYVEYFGMDNSDYIQNKREKIALYEKHNLKLIRIEMHEPTDSQRLLTHIRQDYSRFKTEIFDEMKNF